MSERIQPENNREFTTGPGDWTGDFVWHPETLEDRQGFIAFHLPEGGAVKNMSLAYPHIKPVPNKWNDFKGAILALAETNDYALYSWLITDGVYSNWEKTDFGVQHPWWIGFGMGIDVPSDWDVENTVLNISAYVPSGKAAIVAFDAFHLSVEMAKPQYLPLVGVG